MRSLSFFAFLTWVTQLNATEIKTEIVINASPEKVWAVLTSFKAYPEWNSFITSLEGEQKVGARLKANISDMKFRPKVLVFEKNVEFKWRGRLLMPGIFDGTHRFQLIDNSDGTTTLIHSEKFRGILVPFMKKRLETETKIGFEQMNLDLKNRVEAGKKLK